MRFCALRSLSQNLYQIKDKVLQVQDIIFNSKQSNPLVVQIVLRHHKSQLENEPIIISIQANSTSQFCPVYYRCRYKSLFPICQAPFSSSPLVLRLHILMLVMNFQK
jgi:hypothetical protein